MYGNLTHRRLYPVERSLSPGRLPYEVLRAQSRLRPSARTKACRRLNMILIHAF